MDACLILHDDANVAAHVQHGRLLRLIDFNPKQTGSSVMYQADEFYVIQKAILQSFSFLQGALEL